MKRNNWWMYFVQGEDSYNIKIGISTCPYQRIGNIQAYCTERLKILGIARITADNEQEARDAEAIVHRRFEAQRLYGEIFRPSAALVKVALAKRVGSAHSCPRCSKTTTEPLTIAKRIKPIAVSIASKERHLNRPLTGKRLRPSLYHSKLPRTFFPRRDRDEYGGKVQHLRIGVSITDYSKRVDTYLPSIG